jgi:hypothetical protein
LVVVVSCAAASLLLSAPAMAKQRSCAEQVVADWFDNLRVDKLYPKHCYREAIAGLGPDIKDYTGAEDAILRALQYRNAGESVPKDDAPGSTHKPIELRRYSIAAPAPIASEDASNTAGPSSIPIPLIVLAGLAGLLLIAGGAGYVARRAQARRDDQPPSD